MTTIWNEQAMLAEVNYRRDQAARAYRRQERPRRRASAEPTGQQVTKVVPRRRWSLRGSEAWPFVR